MQSPQYRQATLPDLNELVELRVLMQAEVNKHAIEDFPETFRRDTQEFFLKSLRSKDYICIVAATPSGQILSQAGVSFYDKPPSLSTPKGRIGNVSNVFTRLDHRGQGHARKVLELLIEEARRAGADKLQLGATEVGVKLYEKLGFTPSRFPSLELALSP